MTCTILSSHCRRFLCQEMVVTIANDVGSQQWQWWGQATAAETEAAVGAHNNQTTDGSDSEETDFVVAAAATAAAVAAAVATAALTRQWRQHRQWQWRRWRVRSTLKRGDGGRSRCSRSGDGGCFGGSCGDGGMMRDRGGRGGSSLSWCDHTLVSCRCMDNS